ncbi:MAG: hypothetical protein OXT67_04570 [Zetaproteobacteria bacterium]|nr:hypothetical protein [Zetaproteobacteria bacterium]
MIKTSTYHKLLTVLTNSFFCYNAHANHWSESRHQFIPWGFSRSKRKRGLQIPATAQKKSIKPSQKWLEKRLQPEKIPGTEPLRIWIHKANISKLAQNIATRGFSSFLRTQMEYELTKQNKKSGYFNLANIDQKTWRKGPTIHLFRKKHLQVSIDPKKASPEKLNQLFNQIRPFISRKKYLQVTKKKHSKTKLYLDHHLLPKFAERAVGSFSPFRGPNCFHASLAFHSLKWTKTPTVNITREPGYHWAMINYDELWRALDHQFYPINPKKHPMKYGDLMIYFDVPETEMEQSRPYFRWIRHAAVYLFNDFVFSKGSKSASTSYAVHTIAEEWKTWASRSKKLGVRIFRRKRKYVTKRISPPLKDWIY